MECQFQNNREDRAAFFYFWCKNTDDGKKFIRQELFKTQWRILSGVLSLFLVTWFMQAPMSRIIGYPVLFLAVAEAFIFIRAKFEPGNYAAKQFSIREAESLSPRDLQLVSLHHHLYADNDWLRTQTSEQINSYRWNLIDYIWLTPDYIFIQTWPNKVIIIPKRDFSSEQNFLGFGTKLTEMHENNKNRPIGE